MKNISRYIIISLPNEHIGKKNKVKIGTYHNNPLKFPRVLHISLIINNKSNNWRRTHVMNREVGEIRQYGIRQTEVMHKGRLVFDLFWISSYTMALVPLMIIQIKFKPIRNERHPKAWETPCTNEAFKVGNDGLNYPQSDQVFEKENITDKSTGMEGIQYSLTGVYEPNIQ